MIGTSDPACICPGAASLLTAAFSGTTTAPCPIHQPDAVQALEADAKREAAQTAADRLRQVLANFDQADELAVRRKARQDRADQIEAITDPLERALTRATDLPLNLHPSQYPALQGFTTHDGDDAA